MDFTKFSKLKKFLIVYAHPEPKSYCGAIKNLTIDKLTKIGHEVQITDLYAQNFNPVITKKDFVNLKNEEVFNYMNEQVYSYQNNFSNYSREILIELDKIKWADNIIFIFPLWWGSYPAIMKGWIDKCFVYGHSWTSERNYANGILKNKKGIAVCTCEDTKENYSKEGVQGMSVEEILHHLNRASLEFVGISALKSHVFYKVGKLTQEERIDYLKEFENKLENFDDIELLYKNRYVKF